MLAINLRGPDSFSAPVSLSSSSPSREDSSLASQQPIALAASDRADRALRIGWWFTVIPFFAFGVQHLVYGRFVTRLAPALPAWIPAPTALAYAAGAGLVVASVALVMDKHRARGIAIVLGLLILLSFVVTHTPRLIAAPRNTIMWLQALKCLTLASGAFALAATASRRNRTTTTADGFNLSFVSDRALLGVACAIMGVYLIYCGMLHLTSPVGVSRLVPKWVPGAVGWAYFTGAALALGGLGFWLPPVRRLAAALTSAMIFLWVLMLHIPRAITMNGPNETTATFEALAFSGLALIIAAIPTRKNAMKSE